MQHNRIPHFYINHLEILDDIFSKKVALLQLWELFFKPFCPIMPYFCSIKIPQDIGVFMELQGKFANHSFHERIMLTAIRENENEKKNTKNLGISIDLG